MAGRKRFIVPLVVLVLAFLQSRGSRVDAKTLLFNLVVVAQEWKVQQPLLTAFLGVLLVVAWILSFMPLTPLEVCIGFLFGVRTGYIVVYLGKVFGCTASFMLGRTVARDWAKEQFGKNELLRAVDLAVEREPYKICFIVRLAYIPIAIKNFGLAVLSVTPTVFLVSLAGVELFNSIVLVTVGSTAKDLGALISGQEPKTPAQIAVMSSGCVFVLILFGLMTVFTKRALADVRAQEAASKASNGHSKTNGDSATNGNCKANGVYAAK